MKIPDYKKDDGEWSIGYSDQGKVHLTVGGAYWSNMLVRCKPNGAKQKTNPSYQGVTHSYQSIDDFIEWARKQVGYGLDGFQLDKDLLLKGNKTYCKELCVFLPKRLNTLILLSKATRGDLPIGVRKSPDGKFYSYVNELTGRKRHLGVFIDSNAAFAAYKEAKEGIVKELAGQYRDQIDPRAYAALVQYQVEIND